MFSFSSNGFNFKNPLCRYMVENLSLDLEILEVAVGLVGLVACLVPTLHGLCDPRTVPTLLFTVLGLLTPALLPRLAWRKEAAPLGEGLFRPDVRSDVVEELCWTGRAG